MGNDCSYEKCLKLFSRQKRPSQPILCTSACNMSSSPHAVRFRNEHAILDPVIDKPKLYVHCRLPNPTTTISSTPVYSTSSRNIAENQHHQLSKLYTRKNARETSMTSSLGNPHKLPPVSGSGNLEKQRPFTALSFNTTEHHYRHTAIDGYQDHNFSLQQNQNSSISKDLFSKMDLLSSVKSSKHMEGSPAVPKPKKYFPSLVFLNSSTLDEISLRKTLAEAFQGENGTYLSAVQNIEHISAPQSIIPQEFYIYCSSPLLQGFSSLHEVCNSCASFVF